MRPGFVFALSWGCSLCSVCSLLGFHRFGSMRFDYERSYAMLLGALRKHLKNDCFALDPSKALRLYRGHLFRGHPLAE